MQPNLKMGPKIVGGVVAGFLMGFTVGLGAAIWSMANYVKPPTYEMEGIEAVLLLPIACIVGMCFGAIGAGLGGGLRSIPGVLISAIIPPIAYVALLISFVNQSFPGGLAWNLFIDAMIAEHESMKTAIRVLAGVCVITSSSAITLGAVHPFRRMLGSKQSTAKVALVIPACILLLYAINLLFSPVGQALIAGVIGWRIYVWVRKSQSETDTES